MHLVPNVRPPILLLALGAGLNATQGLSFRGFVENLREQAEARVAPEAAILEESRDGVRLMLPASSEARPLAQTPRVPWIRCLQRSIPTETNMVHSRERPYHGATSFMSTLRPHHLLRGLLPVPLLAWVLGCGPGAAPMPAASPEAYRYRHLETTGLTDEVLGAGGRAQPIRFAPESSESARKSLEELLGCGVYGTCGEARLVGGEPFEQRVFLVGELRPEVRHTPGGPGRATPEEYRMFVLHSVRVETPISVMVSSSPESPDDLDATRHVEERASAEAACPAWAPPAR